MNVLEADPEDGVAVEIGDSAPQIIGTDEERPDTALSLPCVVAPSEGTPSEFEAALSEAEPEDEEQDEGSGAGTEERPVSKRKYPYAAMFFIMAAVVGQR